MVPFYAGQAGLFGYIQFLELLRISTIAGAIRFLVKIEKERIRNL